MNKLLPFSRKAKLKLFLNLEWIFERLAHEESFRVFGGELHPLRTESVLFISERIGAEDRILDLGCKFGEISFFLARKALNVVGVDHNAAVIAEAKKKYQKSNLQFYHNDALAFLQAAQESFDVLILSHILEHLDNPKDFLSKYKKYFRSIYIEVPDFDKSILNIYRDTLRLNLIYSDNDHVSEFDRKELKELLYQSGIQIVDEEFKHGVQRFWCKVIPD